MFKFAGEQMDRQTDRQTDRAITCTIGHPPSGWALKSGLCFFYNMTFLVTRRPHDNSGMVLHLGFINIFVCLPTVYKKKAIAL